MKANTKLVMKEWAESIIIAVILALVIRTFVVQAFKIPSGSMIPTFQVGDRIFVNKFIYGAPIAAAWMVCDLMKVRGWFQKLVIASIIVFLNWEAWQAPKVPPFQITVASDHR